MSKIVNIDKKWLIINYLIRKKTACQMAKQLNLSHPTITRHLKENGIRLRTHSEIQSSKVGELHPQWKNGYTINRNGYVYNTRTHQLKHREVMEKYLNRKLYKNELIKHIDNDKTNNNIENLQIVFRKDQPWSIKRIKAQRKRNKGIRKKPIVKNGKEYSPYWHEIRRKVYARDKYICQKCRNKCVDKKNQNTKKLIQCHHLDNSEKNNSLMNLITLCVQCHIRLHRLAEVESLA